MAKLTVAALRRRWHDQRAAEELLKRVNLFLHSGSLAEPLDLRGAEVGVQGPLADFGLRGRVFSHLDLSYGNGAVIISEATVIGLIADRFRFDRASYFMRSVLRASRFGRAHLHLDAQDVAFEECSFDGSTFAGGFSEYGFRRCTFRRCSFSGIVWRNTYLRACQFHDCTFMEARVVNSVIAGVRILGEPPAPTLFSSSHVSSLSVNGTPTSGSAA